MQVSERHPADFALVEAARDGDRDAFAELYVRYRGAVHAIALSRLSHADASDVVQDVFVIALRRLPQLRKPEAFGGWLMMIARNRAVDVLRRQKPTTELTDSIGTMAAPTAEAAQALAAIKALPDAYRETLIMRLVEGMTGPEIAERSGLTPNSVRVNLHRGMKLLRKKLGLEVAS